MVITNYLISSCLLTYLSWKNKKKDEVACPFDLLLDPWVSIFTWRFLQHHSNQLKCNHSSFTSPTIATASISTFPSCERNNKCILFSVLLCATWPVFQGISHGIKMQQFVMKNDVDLVMILVSNVFFTNVYGRWSSQLFVSLLTYSSGHSIKS